MRHHTQNLRHEHGDSYHSRPLVIEVSRCIKSPSLRSPFLDGMKSRNDKSRGFSLLELMIALSILATLMVVVWTLVLSFRDVQEKGRSQALRTQTIRSLRQWMQEDLLHVASSSAPPPTTPLLRGRSPVRRGTSAPTSTLFLGSSTGFSVTIEPSSDPIPLVERIMLDDPQTPFPEVPIKPSTVKVEYRIEVVEDLPDMQLMRIRRTLTPNPTSDLVGNQVNANGNSPADRTLTMRDLYRVADDSVAAEVPGTSHIVWENITNAKFRYSNGSSWQGSWRGGPLQSMPRAIELCFDLKNERKVAEQRAMMSETPLGTAIETMEVPNEDPSMALEIGEEVASREEEVPLCDVRMVVAGVLP